MKCEQRRLSFEVGANDDYVSIFSSNNSSTIHNPSKGPIQHQSFMSKKSMSNKMDSITTYCKQINIFHKSLIIGRVGWVGCLYNETKCLMHMQGLFSLNCTASSLLWQKCTTAHKEWLDNRIQGYYSKCHYLVLISYK